MILNAPMSFTLGSTPLPSFGASVVGGGGYSYTSGAIAPAPTAASPLSPAGAQQSAAQQALAVQPAAGAYMDANAAGAAGAPAAAATGGGPTAANVDQLVPILQQIVATLQQMIPLLQQQAAAGAAVQGGGDASMAGCTCGCQGTTDAATAGGGAMGAPTAATIGDQTSSYAAPAAAQAAPVAGGSSSTQQATSPGDSLSPSDAELARRIDQKVLSGTGMAGKGSVLVAACRKYQVPVDFMLAIYQKEANFAKSGTLADRNNNPGNLRFADWQTEHGGVKNGGFTTYPTMDDGIRASVHLLSLGTYRSAVDKRDWGGVISRYAPSSENDTATYIKQMNQWTSDFRSKLGIDEHWLHTS